MPDQTPSSEFRGPGNRRSMTQGLRKRYEEGGGNDGGSLYTASAPAAVGGTAPSLKGQKSIGVNFFGSAGGKTTNNSTSGREGLSGNILKGASTAGVSIPGFTPNISAGTRKECSAYGKDTKAIQTTIQNSQMLANFFPVESYGTGPAGISQGDSERAGRGDGGTNLGRGRSS